MNLPLTALRRLDRRRGRQVAYVVGGLVAGLVLLAAIGALARSIEPGALSTIGRQALGSPILSMLAAAAFLGAFAIRALLWTRIAPTLGFGHALAGIMVATGANHVLPFRLGEPLRIVSVVRRAGMRADDATASTVALRVGDILALLLIGAALGPTTMSAMLGRWGLLIVGVLLGIGAVAVISVARAARAGRMRSPDLVTVVGTIAAWFAEAVLIWQVAHWGGIDLGYLEAVVVGAFAVAAQIVAIAPGGVGTYEAAAVAAMSAAGVPFADAVGVAVAVHIAKTMLTVTGGAIALFVPSPTLFGRLRVPTIVTSRPPPTPPRAAASRPVVLFLPAYNEAPRIAEVIQRAPTSILGHPVDVIVVDDGSTDGTADVARGTGASVISHDPNRGLGAAVATGLRAGVDRDAVAVAFCDADGEYDPAELELLVAPIVAGTGDYVVGSRFSGEIRHMRTHRRVGNRVLTAWVRWMARRPITDGQSGYRALSHDAAAETVLAHEYNYAQVLTLDLVMRGFRYTEVPISYGFRTSGRSFVRLGSYLRRCVPAAWRVVNGRVSSPAPTTTG